MAANPPKTEQGQQLVDGLVQSEQAGRLKKAAETYNLSQDMDEGLLREVGQEVYNGYTDDCGSRADWLDNHTFWLSLYMQMDYAENSDPERSWGATESVPILTEACNQFQSRTYKTFFPNETFVSAVPMRRTTQDREMLEQRADRVGKHMSYQLGFQDRSYRQNKDALFLGVPVHGSFFTKTYYDIKNKRPKIDNIRPTDLVVNYHCGPIRIEELRRKTHVINTTIGHTEDLVNHDYFIQPAMSYQSSGKNVYDVKVDESQGISQGNSRIKRDKPALVLEQHVYLDLEGDGQYLPYIATIDAASRKVMRLTIGWEADAQGNPLDDYEQIQYFTHYKFAENPDGFYGLGLGHFIGDINSAVNIMLRQTMDAATLANDGNMSGFINEQLGVESDEIRMVLGKFTKISSTVDDMSKGLMQMKFPGPNDALIKIMEMMDQRAQRMSSTTEATTGAPDQAQQPTTYLAEIEQAMEMFSSVQMRLSNSLSDELMKVYRLNQKYLPLTDYFTVNNTPDIITRADYADDMLIQPIFDPKFATQSQKVARAQAELQATMQNPVNQQRPQVYDEAYRRYFEALEVDNIDALIPPPPPPPANIDNQDAENSMFLQPPGKNPPFDVYPNQHHAEHLAKLEGFVKDKGHLIPPEQQQAVIAHKQMHEGFLNAQQKGLIPEPPRQQPNNALGAGPGNAMGAGQLAGQIPSAAAVNPASIFGISTFRGGPTSSFNSAQGAIE